MNFRGTDTIASLIAAKYISRQLFLIHCILLFIFLLEIITDVMLLDFLFLLPSIGIFQSYLNLRGIFLNIATHASKCSSRCSPKI